MEDTMNATTEITNAADLLNPPVDATTKAKVDKATTCSSAAHRAADAVGIIRVWGAVYTMTATHCTCCGSPLRDSVSVTRGIGPECSRQHYEIDFPITKDMVEEALGLLHASGLDKLVKVAAKQLKQKPRDLCNVLVWWSAAHLDEADVVLDCAAIVTALGFETLGDRVRERTTDVIVTSTDDDSGDFVLRCRARSNVIRNMRRVKEATPVAKDGRFKYGWRFPASRKSLVWTILGEDFGGQWATVPGDKGKASKVVKIDEKSWYEVREALRAAYAPAQPKSAPTPLVVRPGKPGWLEVHTPHRDFGFISEFKAAVSYKHRTWDRDNVCWTVEARFEAKTRELVAKHFNGAK
jgi:hypothetical protein